MRPFSSITNLFSAVLPFLLLDVLDYKANASIMRSLSETATSSSASQLNGRGQPLVPRMTIGYAYWHEAQCQDYDIKALWDLSRAYVVLSPVPKYDAEVYANVQDGSCEVRNMSGTVSKLVIYLSPQCIFEADKDQVLDSKMQYAFPPRGKTLESSTITFLRHRYRIPGMVLKRGNTKNLNIRLELRAVEIIEWNKWPITDWPLGDDSKNKTIDAFKSEWEARNPNPVH
ncbi:hypothetical protein DFJ43DRAFT_181094 [Lentinula guzmanii]|uniref:Uncharacterized protein n=1 Tax=Lentinula guzmanii TaxID=2804957 RepID=A0AA38JL82_9AGAR|nr:hypothetical protein DFJ43DRAFT_181094 [Lentinula guzmanii]